MLKKYLLHQAGHLHGKYDYCYLYQKPKTGSKLEKPYIEICEGVVVT